MHSILSCLLCLSLISPIYVQKYVPGLYQIKSAQKVYLKPSVSSKIVKTLKKGSISGAFKLIANTELSKLLINLGAAEKADFAPLVES